MHNFQEYPPYLYLTQVLDHCPKAGSTYMKIWHKRDRNNEVRVVKKNVYSEYLTSLAKFRHDLLMLIRESLINIDESPNEIHIELVNWEIDAEGQTLC
jgi:hypothetical protein